MTTETTPERIMETITSLERLKKEATIERSHYYVGSTVTKAIEMLYKLLGELHGER